MLRVLLMACIWTCTMSMAQATIILSPNPVAVGGSAVTGQTVTLSLQNTTASPIRVNTIGNLVFESSIVALPGAVGTAPTFNPLPGGATVTPSTPTGVWTHTFGPPQFSSPGLGVVINPGASEAFATMNIDIPADFFGNFAFTIAAPPSGSLQIVDTFTFSDVAPALGLTTGATTGSGLVGIPEPTSMLYLGFVALAGGFARWRRFAFESVA